MQNTNRFAQYDFNDTFPSQSANCNTAQGAALQPTRAPEGEHAVQSATEPTSKATTPTPSPCRTQPPQPPQLTNALIRDLLDPNFSTLDLCDYHALTLSQIVEIMNSPQFKQLTDAFEHINTGRTQLVDHESRFTTKARLNEITKQPPENRHHEETIRKAASKLSTNKPKRKSIASQIHCRKQERNFTLHPTDDSIILISPQTKTVAALNRKKTHMFKYVTPLLLATAAASATTVVAPEPVMYTDPVSGELLCGFTFDISGFNSNDFQGSAFNDTLEVFVGSGIEIDAISWDVNLTTIPPSWADEATIGFEEQVYLAPAFGDSFTVSGQNYSSDGPILLSDFGLPNIILGADGYLSIEFFETGFDDYPGAADAFYGPGSRLGIYTRGWPTPGTASTIAFGALITTRRKR